MHLTSTVQVVVIEYVLPCTLADSLSNVRGGGGGLGQTCGVECVLGTALVCTPTNKACSCKERLLPGRAAGNKLD
jgi:hypothetical protein